VHEELHLTAAASRMCELHDDLEVHVFSRRLGVVMRLLSLIKEFTF
jgi:hypothetical protein